MMDPIEPRDLVPVSELSKSFFRATVPGLTHEEFERKWRRSLASPLRLFRSFPHAYYLDLTRIPRGHVPGETGMCFGDLHPDNFGFLLFEEGFHYVFNDLDDAGIGPVGLDALRYFTALQLSDLVDDTPKLIDFYRDIMREPGRARELPQELYPDHEKLRSERISRLVDGTHFVFTKETKLGAATQDERKLMIEALAEHPRFRACEVLDVARRERAYGGSGGLRRLWALFYEGETLQILELKELAKPATSVGRRFVDLRHRLDHARQALWYGLTPRDHFSLLLGPAEFLVRYRVDRCSFDLESMSKKKMCSVLDAQITRIALHHRDLFHPSEYQRLDDWLQTGAATLCERWKQVYDRARSASS